MTQAAALPADCSFAQAKLGEQLAQLSDQALDALDFGVIGFDADTVVTRYNEFESKAAGLTPQPRAGPAPVHRGGAVHEQLHGGAAFRRRARRRRSGSTSPSITC